MMHARAVATPLVELEQWEAAVNVLDAGIRGIEQFLADYNQQEKAAQVGELAFLQRWKREILDKHPQAKPAADAADESTVVVEEPDDPLDRLRTELERAIAEERYEDAVRLRDDLSRLEDPPPPPPGKWES
jgi:excinuclease UvrABC helicase subunit UvrB